MKKISNLAVIVAAAALLCGISACDNTETITMKSAPIEMVGDPIVTDKAAIFQWKDSVANSVRVTRQASGEEEVTLADGWILNGFADRVTNKNLLKAGVEYTYRFYNTSDVSSARTTEYTLEKKYSCVERKVTFESIAPAGTKLAPFTDDQIKIVKTELNGKNYVSVYVDEKESGVWISIDDTTEEKNYKDLYNDKTGGLEAFEYDPYHDYKIWVGKYWSNNATYRFKDYDETDYDWNWENSNTNYYDTSDTVISFDLAATKNEIDISLEIDPWDDNLEVSWNGSKGCKYEVSLEAFDNQGKVVALKKSTIADADIKKDAFFNCLATVKFSDLGIDIEKPITVKTIKANVKETAEDGTVSEGETEKDIESYLTTYTRLEKERKWNADKKEYEYVVKDLAVSGDSDSNEDGSYTYYAIIKLSGDNLPDTAKLYYKKTWDTNLYSEVTGGLKKDENGYLTAKVSIEQYQYYDFKAVVTTDNKNWYDWEEGKTEEVAERLDWRLI